MRKVYLEAARLVADQKENAACFAICTAAKWRGHYYQDAPEVKAFSEMFRPRSKEGRGFDSHCWLALDSELRTEGDHHPETRHRRIVALCLMAAMYSK